jgi:hypothetical protein
MSKNESGMYLCMGTIPFSKRILTSYYPIMIFVSDPLCKKYFNLILDFIITSYFSFV